MLLIEQFYSVTEVSALLHISKDMARRLFRDRPGVVRLSHGKRPRMRIPESLLKAVITEMGGGTNGQPAEDTGRN
jgi:hypothetical protein